MALKKKEFRSNALYKKILGLLNKKGFKKKAKQVLDFVLKKVAKKLKILPNTVLINIFLKLTTFVELKKIKSRKRIMYIPFYIPTNRRLFLIAKWLFLGSLLNKKKISFKYKMINEILLLLKFKKHSKSLKLKKLNIKKSLENRANSHFRW